MLILLQFTFTVLYIYGLLTYDINKCNRIDQAIIVHEKHELRLAGRNK